MSFVTISVASCIPFGCTSCTILSPFNYRNMSHLMSVIRINLCRRSKVAHCRAASSPPCPPCWLLCANRQFLIGSLRAGAAFVSVVPHSIAKSTHLLIDGGHSEGHFTVSISRFNGPPAHRNLLLRAVLLRCWETLPCMHSSVEWTLIQSI